MPPFRCRPVRRLSVWKRSWVVGFVALIVLGVVSVPVSAQSLKQAEKQAVKELKGATKTAAKDFKAKLKTELQVVLLRLKMFQAEVKSGDFSSVNFLNLLDDVEDFQLEVAEAMEAALSTIVADGMVVYAGFVDTAPDDSDPPAVLHYGHGTGLDQISVEMGRELDKTYTLLAKRFEKLALLLEKKANIGFLFRIRSPLEITQRVLFDEAFSVTVSLTALRWDFLASFSDLSSADDATLHLSGQGDGFEGDVTFSAPASPVPNSTVPVDFTTRRWVVEYVDQPEGNILFLADQEGGGRVAFTFAAR